jgi:hypothetical protein
MKNRARGDPPQQIRWARFATTTFHAFCPSTPTLLARADEVIE